MLVKNERNHRSMGESFITYSSMDNYYPSTFLSIEPASSRAAAMAGSLEESEREQMIHHRRQISLSLPAPDINLPVSGEISTPPPSWSSDSCEILDLSPRMNEVEATVLHYPNKSYNRKCTKKGDSFWGAWFFFNFYFKPLLSEKSKAKIIRDEIGFSGFDKSDLRVDVFLVQHDMENMYMWIFKERPDNALGKMQLRSYMNGHSRLGESQFPFSVDKGFVRSHRMQRKHYKGLSNPQCIHGIEIVRSPNLSAIPDDDRKKWMEITGRDLNFHIPPEASDFGSWRNLPIVDIEPDRSSLIKHSSSRRLLNGSGLNLINQDHDSDAMDLSLHSNKRRKDSFSFTHAVEEDCSPDRPNDIEIHPIELPWINDFSGVMRHASGPVTAAKTIYEDEEGYLIMVSLPLSDQQRVKVCWRNDLTHGIVKISCFSTSRMPFIKRHDRTFKLSDRSPEHCPPGEFVREISLATRIHEDAKIEAYYDETGTVLEIMVPKHGSEPEEHEVHVSLRPPHLGTNDLMLT